MSAQAMPRARDVDGLHRASEALDGQREQAVVRSDEDAVVLGGAHGHRAALAARPRGRRPPGARRREVGQRAAQHERAGAHVVAIDPVLTSMTRAAGAIRAMTPWHTPYELVVVAVVGQEGDHCRHRDRGESSVVAAARRPGSVSDMSDQPEHPRRRSRAGCRPTSPEAPLGVPRRARKVRTSPSAGPTRCPAFPRRASRRRPAEPSHGRPSWPTLVDSASERRNLDRVLEVLVGILLPPAVFGVFALLAMWLGAESRPWFDERPVVDDRPNWWPIVRRVPRDRDDELTAAEPSPTTARRRPWWPRPCGAGRGLSRALQPSTSAATSPSGV